MLKNRFRDFLNENASAGAVGGGAIASTAAPFAVEKRKKKGKKRKLQNGQSVFVR